MMRQLLAACFTALILTAIPPAAPADQDDYAQNVREVREEQRENYQHWLEEQREHGFYRPYYYRFRGPGYYPPQYYYPMPRYRFAPGYGYGYGPFYRRGGLSIRGPFGGGLWIQW